jgi:hypothetical protein
MQQVKQQSAALPAYPGTLETNFGKMQFSGLTKFEKFVLDTVSRSLSSELLVSNVTQDRAKDLTRNVIALSREVFDVLDAHYDSLPQPRTLTVND